VLEPTHAATVPDLITNILLLEEDVLISASLISVADVDATMTHVLSVSFAQFGKDFKIDTVVLLGFL
jgi:hypothetical protein